MFKCLDNKLGYDLLTEKHIFNFINYMNCFLAVTSHLNLDDEWFLWSTDVIEPSVSPHNQDIFNYIKFHAFLFYCYINMKCISYLESQ